LGAVIIQRTTTSQPMKNKTTQKASNIDVLLIDHGLSIPREMREMRLPDCLSVYLTLGPA
jgi:hypothetical protein